MQHFENKHLKIVMVAVLFLLTSCNILPATETAVPATGTPKNSSIIETLPSATMMSTSIPIQPTQPTLAPTEVSRIIRDMYITNGGCELPCLWGIMPGKTQIQDIHGKLSQIGTFKDITRPVDNFQTVAFTVLAPADLIGIYNDETWSFHLRLENSLVVGLLTGVTVIEEFSNPSLSKFLSYFGKPEEIWVMDIEDMTGNPDYEIVLYYPSKGIFIRWRGEVESVVTQTQNSLTVMVCPQYMPTESDTKVGSYPPHFYLFSPNAGMKLDEIIKKHLSEDPGGSYQLIDNVDLNSFYIMYLDPNTQDCFPITYSL
jgi:hypothetical protein